MKTIPIYKQTSQRTRLVHDLRKNFDGIIIASIGALWVLIYLISEYIEEGSIPDLLHHLFDPALSFYHLSIVLTIPSSIIIGFLFQKEKNLKNSLELKVKERTRRINTSLAEKELAERELLELTETLSEAVEEKTREVLDMERMSAAGKVAAMVGHDLRGPLQTIKNSLYLMERNPDEGAKFRETMDEAVDYAASMLEELRLNVGDTPIQLQEVNLGSLIRKVVDEESIPSSVETEVQVDDGLGSVSLDPLKIRRVLDNLVRNAVEAMPDGGTLNVSAQFEEEEVEITVRDTGTGIPEELIPDLFKAFVTTKPKGMGLGLPYCKRAIEAHSGTIAVESEVGKGTSFTVKFPLFTFDKEH